jgi:hypothetical protein
MYRAFLFAGIARYSLIDCLSKQSMREGSGLRRIRRGWYGLR